MAALAGVFALDDMMAVHKERLWAEEEYGSVC